MARIVRIEWAVRVARLTGSSTAPHMEVAPRSIDAGDGPAWAERYAAEVLAADPWASVEIVSRPVVAWSSPAQSLDRHAGTLRLDRSEVTE